MRAAIVAILLSACAQPDVVSSLGAQSWTEGTRAGLTRQSADDMEQDLIKQIITFGVDARPVVQDFSNIQIHWVNDGWRRPGDTYTREGEEFGYNILLKAHDGCPWMSGYRHEELHLIHQLLGIPTDFSHVRPEWAVVVPIECGPTFGQ